MSILIKFHLYLYFVFLISVIYSCSSSEKEKLNVTYLTHEQASSIFIRNYYKKPDTVYIGQFTNYFAAEDWDYLYCFMSFAKTWQEYFKYEKSSPGIHEVDWVLIDSIKYIYFVSESSGNRFGSVTFHLNSLDDVDKKYSISYEGNIGFFDEINPPITKELKSKIKILEYLENKIANSNLVYHPSPEDLDISHPKNYVWKWNLENQEILTEVENIGEETLEVKFFYYDENLFDILSDSEIGSIENEKFGVKSFFYYQNGYGFYNYHIYGFNKKENKYFVIWIGPYWDDPNDFICELKFVSTNSISFKYNNETYIIDLISGKLHGIKKTDN